MFFVTPVWWDDKNFSNKAIILDLNPFYHLVSLIRKPLMNESISVETLIFLALFFFIFVPLTFLLFNKKYEKITFWL
jgi:ABC-2 type transport system permease protein/lipopolysaccharide transport system permease protein